MTSIIRVRSFNLILFGIDKKKPLETIGNVTKTREL